MTILERVMTAWCLVDVTPLRTSQEAEETKEKRKRKVQIMFLAPSVKFRRPMLGEMSLHILRHLSLYVVMSLVPVLNKDQSQPVFYQSWKFPMNERLRLRPKKTITWSFLVLVLKGPGPVWSWFFLGPRTGPWNTRNTGGWCSYSWGSAQVYDCREFLRFHQEVWMPR